MSLLSVFLFPRAGFHGREGRTDDHLYIFAAETTGRAAAVHRGVPAAEDDDSLPYLFCMLKGHAAEPVDTDVNVCRTFLSSGQIREIASTRSTRADKYRVVVSFENFIQ